MDRIHAILIDYWPHLAFAISIVAGTGAAVHAAMTKQDVRAAIGWVGVALFSPLFGALFYFVAGINRIRKTRLTQQRDEAMVVDAEQVETLPVDVAPISGPQFASLKVLVTSEVSPIFSALSATTIVAVGSTVSMV